MDNTEFLAVQKRLISMIQEANIVLPNGKPVPEKLFHCLLGIGFSTWNSLGVAGNSRRDLQPYTAKTTQYLALLPYDIFLQQVMIAIEEYAALHLKVRSVKFFRTGSGILRVDPILSIDDTTHRVTCIVKGMKKGTKAFVRLQPTEAISSLNQEAANRLIKHFKSEM